MTQPIRVLVPLAQGFEEIEAVTAIDVFRRAGFEVVAAGVDGTEPLRASNGTVIVPDAALGEVIGDPFDLVAVPGGLANTERLLQEQPLLDLLRRRFAAARPIAAICAAPRVLDAAGIASQVALTSHPLVREHLTRAREYREDIVVTDGPVTTSRGAGTAMEWALHLVERLAGLETRHQVEVGLALRPPPSS